MTKRSALLATASLFLACTAALAQEENARPAAPAPGSTEKQEAQIKATQPAMVIVEYTLQYDKGDAPTGGGFAEKCPLCGRYHADNVGDVVKEERPLERAGILLDDTHVLTADAEIHPRFIKSIAVRRYSPDGKSGPSVPAAISAYPRDHNAVMLELSGKLEGAQAPTFDAKRGADSAGGLSLVSLSEEDGVWAMGVSGFGGALVVAGDKKMISAPSGLVVDKSGAAVGVSTGIDINADGSWKGSPLDWPAVSAADMKKSLASLDEKAAKSIVRVTLNFRSPKNISAEQAYHMPGNDPGATVQYVLGVVLDDKTLLVLAELKPTQTARLERIKIASEPAVEAKFSASLRDYGAFVATLEKPVTGGLAISKTDAQSLKGAVLPTAEVFLQGDKRVSYVQPRRIAGFTLGWKKHLYPDVAGETRGLFMFDPQGAMIALPIARREQVNMDGRYGNSSPWLITPVSQVSQAVNDLKTNADLANVPLTEEQENRLAWVGFEMQPMNTELARANNVSDQTSDGDTGALVTFVYPDSPAGKAGVEPGWVLLRIDSASLPKPIDVRVTNEMYSERPFPWDQLAQAPEGIFDRVLELSPWPRAENAVVRAVTDLGFGKSYTAEFFHDGKVVKKTFTVVQGPTYFDNAPKYKQEAMGLTVKNLTYEVRRYMQKKADDPGVIIGKIEMGSRASKAGLKPYEVITHVNETPVMNVQDFEKLTQGQSEVRLSVKLMTHGRIVKIKLKDDPDSPAATAPAAAAKSGPATVPADAGGAAGDMAK